MNKREKLRIHQAWKSMTIVDITWSEINQKLCNGECGCGNQKWQSEILPQFHLLVLLINYEEINPTQMNFDLVPKMRKFPIRWATQRPIERVSSPITDKIRNNNKFRFFFNLKSLIFLSFKLRCLQQRSANRMMNNLNIIRVKPFEANSHTKVSNFTINFRSGKSQPKNMWLILLILWTKFKFQFRLKSLNHVIILWSFWFHLYNQNVYSNYYHPFPFEWISIIMKISSASK